ncbi:MAG: sigma-70 family RNA polymerase sigma factor [Pseudomonadota bacterium]|nr:sigma-70 family RNA polymerase sigma factor [Pseudomonadota bacterium]
MPPSARPDARPDPGLTVERWGPLVWALCHRLDPQPEDAWQEVWEKVLRALPAFDPAGPAALSTWITRITHHHLVDRYRQRRRRGAPEDDDVDALPAPAAPESPVDLEAALATLPEAWRRVIVLHHLHEVPLEAIAATEGVAVGTIKSRLHRARNRLSEILR